MPRKHLSKIHEFYYYTDGRSICQVTDITGNVCEVAVKGRHAGNLEKHVYRNHEAVWNDYYHNFKLPSLVKEEASPLPTPKRPKLLPEYVKVTGKSLDTLNFTYRHLEKACITMATVDGRPLSFVDDIGFRMILNPLLEIMNSNDKKDYPTFAINKNTLQKLIREEAETIKFDIIKKVSNKLISLKIDCASILGKYFLCYSIFLREACDTITYTMPLIEIQDITDTDSIRMMILESLALHGITPAQIYSVLVDSTLNIVGSADLLKDENVDELFFEKSKDDENIEQSETNDSNLNDTEYDTFVIEVDYDHDTIDNVVVDSGQNNSVDKDEEFVNKVIECWSDDNINTSICPAHIFQMVIKEATKNSNLSGLAKKARDIVKKYRTPENMQELYSYCKRTLTIDNPDRWISTYDMFKKLVELKPFMKRMSQSKELFIPAPLWKQMNDFVDSYEPVKIALQRILTENVSLSEFFKIWTSCFLKTKKLGTSLSIKICEIMEQYQKTLFQDILFVSCLFLDPRFKNILEEECIPKVVNHLSELYMKISSMKPSDDENYEIDFVDITDFKSEPEITETVISDRVHDRDVDEFIKSMIKLPADENPEQTKEKIELLLKTFFESEPLLGVKEDVLKFWNEKKYAYPELYKLSQCVFAVSASHYSTNKFISQLKYLYNPYFTVSLGLPLVNDILTVRVNSDVAKFK